MPRMATAPQPPNSEPANRVREDAVPFEITRVDQAEPLRQSYWEDEWIRRSPHARPDASQADVSREHDRPLSLSEF